MLDSRTLALVPWLLTITVTAVASGAPPATANRNREITATSAVADPSFKLIHDNAVRRELKLTPAQLKSLDFLLRKNSRLLLSVRDVGPAGAAPALQGSLDELRQSALRVLNVEQRARFDQLVLQAQGFDALRREDVARDLALSPPQRKNLLEYASELRSRARELEQSSTSNSAERRQELLSAAQKKHREQVLGELTPEQQHAIAVGFGEKFDLSQVRPSAAWAPELENVGVWINSSPRTLESLRGNVVVVHFFTFGCINCIHNYPWYREWQSELPEDDVVMIGIHTPETTAEADIEMLRASLAEHQLTFPVAVDNAGENWRNWSNNIWPAVYLIDREGRVRYWWYGELDWQGAGGQNVMRRRIDELLAESAAAK